MINIEKLFWPERLEGEEFNTYRARRRLSQLTDKSYRDGAPTTVFVQRELSSDEWFDKLWKRKWWRNPEGKKSFVQEVSE